MSYKGIKLFVLSLLAVVSTSAGAQNYTATRNIRYAERRAEVAEDDSSSDRLLDVYVPSVEMPRKGYPTVVFIHGGGFAAGDKYAKNKVNPMIQGFLGKGYAVVAINYILELKGSSHSCIEDMKDGLSKTGTYDPVVQKAIDDAAYDAFLAMRWIKENGKEYGLNSKKISISGGSAGAIACLALAYQMKPKNPPVKAVICLWGAMADPSSIGGRNIPPMFVFHGVTDQLVHIDNGRALAARMEQISRKSRACLMEGRGHSQYKYVAQEKMDEIDEFLRSVGAK